MEIFWKTIAQYNAATWIYQVALILTGIVSSVLLIRRPRQWLKLSMKIYLIVLYLWIAVAYYIVYCAERKFNTVMALFWGIMALIWVVDLIKGHTTFERSHKYDSLAYLLLSMPFLYPIFSLLRGLTFPGITSPVMPCSVAVFSIGLMLLFVTKINMFLVLFLCHWSIIAISKTYFFNIPEDTLLAGASIPALYLFFKEYFRDDLHKDAKPKAKYINFLLLLICILFAVMLTVTLMLGSKANMGLPQR
jgi:hypothetical protein